MLLRVDLDHHFNRLLDFHYDYERKIEADYSFAFTWDGKDMISGVLSLEIEPSVTDEENMVVNVDQVTIKATYPASLRKDLIKVPKRVFNGLLQKIGEDVMGYME